MKDSKCNHMYKHYQPNNVPTTFATIVSGIRETFTLCPVSHRDNSPFLSCVEETLPLAK